MQQDILHDTPLFQSIYNAGFEQGLQEGKKKGRLEVAREVLLMFVHARFPKLDKLAKQETEQMQNPEIVIDLIFKIALAQDRSQAIDYLIDWEETYKDLLQ